MREPAVPVEPVQLPRRRFKKKTAHHHDENLFVYELCTASRTLLLLNLLFLARIQRRINSKYTVAAPTTREGHIHTDHDLIMMLRSTTCTLEPSRFQIPSRLTLSHDQWTISSWIHSVWGYLQLKLP